MARLSFGSLYSVARCRWGIFRSRAGFGLEYAALLRLHAALLRIILGLAQGFAGFSDFLVRGLVSIRHLSSRICSGLSPFFLSVGFRTRLWCNARGQH
jgi:hypothetical protein